MNHDSHRLRGADRPEEPHRLYLGVGLFFTSAALLMLEVSLTRIFSVVMWYHFAFFAISVALFGLAASGLTVQLWPRIFKQERSVHVAFVAAAAFAVAVPICFKLFSVNPSQTFLTGILSLAWQRKLSAGSVLGVAVFYLMAAFPFYIGGLVGANLFRHFGDRASRLYSFDLVGAGFGCLVTVPVLSWVGGPATMAVVALLAAFAALFFALLSASARQTVLALVLVVAGATVVLVNPRTGWLRLKYYRGLQHEAVEYEKWNSFSYVDVRRMSSPDSLLIEIDAASNTVISRWDGNPESVSRIRRELIAAQYVFFTSPKVLSIGTGGGVDILAALTCGAKDVTAVEVNPIIVNLMLTKYAEFSGNVYRAPGVKAVIDEARSYIRRSPELYDVIQAGYVDTYAATAAGAFALTENTLYTREAFSDYLGHLTPNGIISFQRYYEEVPQQGIRLVSVALAALRERGTPRPAQHIAVLRAGERASVLVRNSPFTMIETERLAQHCDSSGLELVAAPGRYGNNIYGELLTSTEPDRVIAHYRLDISAPTDDRPFFFYMIKPTVFWRGLFIRSGEFLNSRAVFLLTTLLLIVVVLAAFVVVLPALVKRELSLVNAFPALIYFGALGLGFMMVEIGMLQRLMLFLGHPSLALSVVLFSLLVSAGLGSAWTGRIPIERVASRLRLLLLIIIVVITIVTFIWSPALRALIGLPRLARAAISIAMLAPVGFFLGTAFPLGIRRLAVKRSHLIAWAWATNGATSVLGSILAMVVAINNGFTATLLVGAVFYLGALWLAPRTE